MLIGSYTFVFSVQVNIVACRTGQTYEVSGLRVRPRNRVGAIWLLAELGQKGPRSVLISLGIPRRSVLRAQGTCQCGCGMGRQDCSAFRPCAEPSQHLCGNLCAATAVLHVLQPSGCIFIIRHVRSLRFLRWASMTGGCAPLLRLLACGAVLLVCKALSPLNTKGDDAADPEESDVRGSGERFSQ